MRLQLVRLLDSLRMSSTGDRYVRAPRRLVLAITKVANTPETATNCKKGRVAVC